jgi:hypothetical protein
MNKKTWHRMLTISRKIKLRYIVIPLVLSTTVSVFALRNNNLTMVRLRDEVYQADKNDQNVNAALNNLRFYVYSHMNTGLSTGDSVYPPIQLKYTYQRLEQAQATQVKAENANVYTDAQIYCQQQIPNGFSGRVRVPCIEQYVTTHTAVATPIPSAMYKFDFVDPLWSPDLAGFSVLVSVVLLLIFIVRLVLVYSLKWLVK